MAKEKKNFVREVTFDGHTIIDTDALLADPDVQRKLQKLAKAFRLARLAQRDPLAPSREPHPAQ